MSHPTDANCIFCKIVAGQIPSYKLLEDDKTIAFMDINPVNPGHSLSVAKGHWPMVDTIPTDVLGAVVRLDRQLEGLPLVAQTCRATDDNLALRKSLPLQRFKSARFHHVKFAPNPIRFRLAQHAPKGLGEMVFNFGIKQAK